MDTEKAFYNWINKEWTKIGEPKVYRLTLANGWYTRLWLHNLEKINETEQIHKYKQMWNITWVSL